MILAVILNASIAMRHMAFRLAWSSMTPLGSPWCRSCRSAGRASRRYVNRFGGDRGPRR